MTDKKMDMESVKPCLLIGHCPNKTAICSVTEPDDGCYYYRYFKKLIEKESGITASQIVASWCETEPQPIKDYINNPRYVTAVCRCPVPLAMGIVIDKEKCISDNGWYHFHCTKCGLRGKVYG